MESEILKIHNDLAEGRTTCSDLVSRKISELEGSTLNTANFLLTETAMESAARVDVRRP